MRINGNGILSAYDEAARPGKRDSIEPAKFRHLHSMHHNAREFGGNHRQGLVWSDLIPANRSLLYPIHWYAIDAGASSKGIEQMPELVFETDHHAGCGKR